MTHPFLKAIHSRPILADGGMGTVLYARGASTEGVFEQLNATNSDLVLQVHVDYLKAGAEVIETNTFSGNRFRLGNYGLADQVSALNIAAAKIARNAREIAGQPAFIAGAVGPTGQLLQPLGETPAQKVLEAFKEQMEALLAGGVDLFIIETMSSLEEMKLAIQAARSISKLPVVAEFSFSVEGHTLFGVTPEDSIKLVIELGKDKPDVIGINCGAGPGPVFDNLLRMTEAARAKGIPSDQLTFSALPNAGQATLTAGRYQFLSQPDYCASYVDPYIHAGARLIGGCCGTTPEHIKAMRKALDNYLSGNTAIEKSPITTHARKPIFDTAASEPEKPLNLLSADTAELSEASRNDIKETLASLSPTERDILRLRFGLDDGRQQSLETVSQLFGLTPEYIKQVETKALNKLRLTHRGQHLTITKHLWQSLAERLRHLKLLTGNDKDKAVLDTDFFVSVELDPPKGPIAKKLIRAAHQLVKAGADAINVGDSPMARVRMSSIAACELIASAVDVETIIHFTTRDRNLMGIQADLLGCQALGINNILALTGDPPALGNYVHATAVYDVDSVGLIKIIKQLNNGVDIAGNTIGSPTNLSIACALNANAKDRKQEIERFKRKLDAGADFVMTQPIYQASDLTDFLETFGECPAPILVGIMPLNSFRHAEYLHNEVPGISIPEHIRKQMEKAQDQGAVVGLELAMSLIEEVRHLCQGVYLVPSFGRYDDMCSLLNRIKTKTATATH